MTHLCVKVTEALIVVAEAAIALIEQVLVDAAFFKDGNDVLDAVRADVRALDEDFDDRAAIGGETEVDFLGGGIVFLGDDLDFSLHPILALVVLEHAGEGAIAGIVIDVRAGSEVRVAAKLRHAHSRVAGDLDLADACLRCRRRPGRRYRRAARWGAG